MALNAPELGQLLKTKIEAATGNAMPEISQNIWNAVAEAIVEHIIARAVVTSTVAVVSVSGVTTGPGVSGPGTGTATGNIS